MSSASGPCNARSAVSVADVFNGRVKPVVRIDPLEIFGDVRRIDHEHEVFGSVSVDEQIVNHGAVRVSHRRILGLPVTQLRSVVGGDVLDQVQSLGAADLEFAHVADVEQAGGCPHGRVFFGDAAVFDGHFPAAEWNQSCTQRLVHCK